MTTNGFDGGSSENRTGSVSKGMFVDPGIHVDLHSLEDRTSSNSGFPPRERVDLRSTTANCVIRCKVVNLWASIKPATFRNPARTSSNWARQACRQHDFARLPTISFLPIGTRSVLVQL